MMTIYRIPTFFIINVSSLLCCATQAVSYKTASSPGWTQMTDISTLPPVLARGVSASSVATPNVLGLPIPDFLGATTQISKMDAKGAFLKSPMDYTFTLQNVALGTPWSLTVVDGQNGEIICGDLSTLLLLKFFIG
jgi:hypothetical protein